MKGTALGQPVPFFGVQRENLAHEEEYCAAIQMTLRHGKSLQGPEVVAFEKAIANRCRRDYAVAVNSATDALFFALISSGIGPGDEVIVTSFSFIASASAIVRAGAKPVFVDIERPSFHMSLHQARQRITERTKGIVVVHLFGQMVDPRAVRQLAEEARLPIIEDAAQALGSRWGDIPAGSLGLASALSFDPTKVLSAPGSGGVVLTDDPQIRDRIRALRYHGMNANGDFSALGYNSQMSSLTAALLGLKLAKLDWFQRRRQQIAASYNEALSLMGLDCPVPSGDSEHTYHKYVLVVAEGSAELQHALTASGIETRVHYRRPLPFEPMFAHLGYTRDTIPIASSLQGKLLSLPIHPFLRDEEVERVISCVVSARRARTHDRRQATLRGASTVSQDQGELSGSNKAPPKPATSPGLGNPQRARRLQAARRGSRSR